MHRFWALLKILLINYLGISIFQMKTSKNRKPYFKKIGLVLLIIVALAPTIALYVKLLVQGFDVLAPLGQEGAILTLGIVLVSFIVFLFGIFYIINFFYFADDAQNLLALPLSGYQVLGARFSVVLVNEYLSALPFLLPPLLVYGIKSGASVLYWLYALVGFALVPLLPLGLATIPTVIIMRFANLSRRKDLLKILGGLAVIVLAVGYQFLFQKSGPNAMDTAYLQHLLTDRSGLMNLMSRVFPSTRYLGLALINADQLSGLVNLLVFAGLSLLVVALAWLTGDKLYFKGLVGSTETAVKRKKLSEADYRRVGKGLPPLLSYWAKEMRLLFRTPTYFINSVMTNLLVPVLLTIPFFIQGRNQEITMPWEKLLSEPRGQTIIMAIIVGGIVFIIGSNAVTATSISREGRELYVSKYIPLSYRKQILAKLLSGYLLGMSGAVLMIIAARVLMPLDNYLIAMLVGVSLVAIIPVAEAGLLIDLYNPKLNWENEQQAFKQNFNVIFSMLVAILLGGGIIYIVIRYIHTPVQAALFMLLGFGLAALFLYYFLMTWGVRRCHELEG
ncbi:putative ABC transporter permease subunit [Syntrophomonas wolfei]|uniref:Conserved hypothetical membrane protein n=1 Tax=Syntrophomonas wolfei subsp. wolfei (strain DSM 2245B / Goettingen) TaxID=335541 RepID=Q0AVC1_SYNWW|nr:hypothetical protein [Syntrophomonas wolfei]ABI69333.1 conserved hypothetical membrane protein [Syntrophomonas wolfei subsp. wolfei str. Goettingen G311]